MKSILCLAIVLMMMYSPNTYIPAARTALRIWGLDVVPSLFPYMVFCRILAAQLRRQRVPAAPVAAFLGLLGGSPSGASVLAAYGSILPRKTLFALTALTGTISPVFLLNTVNQWIQNPAYCLILLFCHLFGAVFACIFVLLCMRKTKRMHQDSECADMHMPEQDAIQQSIAAVLNIGGCIVIFSVVSVFLCRIAPFSRPLPSALIHAVFEAAGGIHALSMMPDTPMRAVLIASVSSFSGFSILSQNLFFLRPLGICMPHLIAFALLRSVASGGAMILCQILVC